jgi:membrane protein implicated in regulation of membrane protease activity
VVDWGFENGNLDAWTKEGTAFDDQPVFGDNPTARNRGQPSNHVGDYWIGTYEKYQGLAGETAGSRQGDSVTGVITSPEFTITEQFVSFLVGGGAHAGTSGQFNRGTFVSLLVGSEEVFRQTGFNHETMRRVSHDISAYMGRRAVIKIVDMESGGWGHINCDDFLWYTPTSTASVSPVPSTTPSASATASTTPSASATASPAVIDWGFENRNLDAWTKEGTAFDSQPTFGDNPTARNRGQPSNHVGHSWIGTYERYQGLPNERAGVTQGDHPTGIITSPEFTITSSSVSFLVGGGAHAGTSGQFNRGTFVSLLVGSEEVFRQPGFNHETMRRVTKDISAYMGRTAVVKIVDMESGGWGHINCDDFIWS